MVQQELKMEPISKKIQKQWFGHLMGMDNSRTVKKIVAKMTWKKKRGRLRKTQENKITDILKERNMWNEVNNKT